MVDFSKFYMDSKANSIIFMETQTIWNSSNNSEKEEHKTRVTLPDLNTYCEATLTSVISE